MQTRSSDEKAVFPSVCLSVKRVNCDKTEERSVQIFIWKIIYSSFLRRRMIVEATPSTWNFGSAGPRWSEITDFQPIFARSSSAVKPSEKSSINTNRKSTTSFPLSLRWSSYVALESPKGGLKRKMADFHLKSYFTWRKFLCVKNVSAKL